MVNTPSAPRKLTRASAEDVSSLLQDWSALQQSRTVLTPFVVPFFLEIRIADGKALLNVNYASEEDTVTWNPGESSFVRLGKASCRIFGIECNLPGSHEFSDAINSLEKILGILRVLQNGDNKLGRARHTYLAQSIDVIEMLISDQGRLLKMI